jgi:hypothetical protein
MVQPQAKPQPDAEEPASDSGEALARGKIGVIMDKYRAIIDDINSKTTDKNYVVSDTESNTEDSEIISRSKLKIQKASIVMDGIGNDVRKLEAYGKALTMVRRSLTSACRNYSYILVKKQEKT